MVDKHNALGDDTTPDWTTQSKQKYADGRVVGVSNQVWLYRKVALSPVETAVSDQEAIDAGATLANAMAGLEAITTTPVARRVMAKSRYREIHMLLVNINTRYVPDQKQEPHMREFLQQVWPNRSTQKRILLFGVRLNPSLVGRKWSDTLKNLVDTLSTTDSGVNLAEYAKDARLISDVLTNAGMSTPSADDLRTCDSWWNAGRYPDVPNLVHSDHLHFFTEPTSLQQAARLVQDEVDCTSHEWRSVPHQNSISFNAFDSFNFEFTKAGKPKGRFFTELLHNGAVAVSVRGFVEPTNVTRNQLRSGRRRYETDLNEAASSHNMSRQEQQDKADALKAMDDAYASAESNIPTLHDASIIAAIDGFNAKTNEYGLGSMASSQFSSMVERQEKAFAEMMMGSKYRGNPLRKDLPITAIAYTGATSLAKVGDRSGALLGMTEFDNQPAYISPVAASATDSLPLMVVAGQTGSGKLLPLDAPIPTPDGWTTMGELRVGDRVLGRNGKVTAVSYLSEVNEKPDLYEVVLSDGQVIEADSDHQWIVSNFQDRNGARHPHRITAQENWDRLNGIANTLMSEHMLLLEQPTDIDGLFDVLDSHCGNHPWKNAAAVASALSIMGVTKTADSRYDTWDLLKLGERLRQQIGKRPSGGYGERRMTTGEMLAEGLRTSQGHARFAIRTPDAVQLPESDLPLDPYVFGAWLGDGDSDGSGFTCAVEHQDHMVERFKNGGFALKVRPSSSNGQRMTAPGLRTALVQTGLRRNERRPVALVKRIPTAYLRGSVHQRLSLLQGLMDTDGTVSAKGTCELSLSDADLARDALELIRSLGIKASLSVSPSSYVSDTGERIAGRDRHRIKFTTTTDVCTIPHKADRLPSQVRQAQGWLYVTDIRPIESRPGRCIQVEDPDHAYLCSGFVPTSNTQCLLWLAFQYDEMGSPQVIVDPKRKSDHTTTVINRGGQVYRLDRLIEADGIMDPLRFSQDIRAAVQAASSALLYIDPWGLGSEGTRRWETELGVALHYGVEAGATCTGQALQMAVEAGEASKEMVEPIMKAREAYPMLAAICGVDPQGEGLSVSDGMTLIMAGEIDIPLPAPGQEASTIDQRLGVSLVRMLVFGSAMALTERRGVLHFDEAWIAMIGGTEEVERLGRLARSQQVLPILYTQRVSDVVEAGLQGYISRGLVFAIKDPIESRAACELFGMEPTPERLGRIEADDKTGAGPNYNSLRPLFEEDEDTGKRIRNLRGAVAFYKDLNGNVCPVTVDLPPWFLSISTTNTADLEESRKDPSQREAAIARLKKVGTQEAADEAVVAEAEQRAAAAAEAEASRTMSIGDVLD